MPDLEGSAASQVPMPLVSVVLPIRNEEQYIQKCLEAILRQDYPKDLLEIIIVDGMSEDATRLIVRDFVSKDPRLIVLDNPRQIVPTALNIAIMRSRGQIVARVDGHCEIAPDYIRNCVKALQENSIQGVGGPIETIGTTSQAEIIALAMSSPFGVGSSGFRTRSKLGRLVDTVPFPAYWRSAIDSAGLFDEELVRNQDDEFNYRLRGKGGRILLSPQVRSVYYSRGSLRSLWQQYFQYGMWKVRVLQKHPMQMQLRQFVPAVFVAVLGVGVVSALWLPAGRLLLLGVLGAYLVSNGLMSFLTALRARRPRYTFSLFAAFSCLHLGYGFGFFRGLFRFWNRWGDRTGQVPESLRA